MDFERKLIAGPSNLYASRTHRVLLGSGREVQARSILTHLKRPQEGLSVRSFHHRGGLKNTLEGGRKGNHQLSTFRGRSGARRSARTHIQHTRAHTHAHIQTHTPIRGAEAAQVGVKIWSHRSGARAHAGFGSFTGKTTVSLLALIRHPQPPVKWPVWGARKTVPGSRMVPPANGNGHSFRHQPLLC